MVKTHIQEVLPEAVTVQPGLLPTAQAVQPQAVTVEMAQQPVPFGQQQLRQIAAATAGQEPRSGKFGSSVFTKSIGPVLAELDFYDFAPAKDPTGLGLPSSCCGCCASDVVRRRTFVRASTHALR